MFYVDCSPVGLGLLLSLFSQFRCYAFVIDYVLTTRVSLSVSCTVRLKNTPYKNRVIFRII